MSSHIERVHRLDSIGSKEKRKELIESAALDDIEINIMTMRHIGHKPFDYIADSVGLSVRQVGRRYKKALELVMQEY